MRNGATMPPFAVWCLALVTVLLPEASGDAREAHHRPQMRREPLQHSMAPEPGEAELSRPPKKPTQPCSYPPDLPLILALGTLTSGAGLIGTKAQDLPCAVEVPRSASVGSRGDIFVQDEDDDGVCKSLCHAVDAPWQIKLSSASRVRVSASSAFYETLDDGSRRPCSLQAAGASLSDPEAQNCGVDSKQICHKGSPLCQEDAPSSHGPLEEICNLCSGGGEFLPEATAFMEDGKPFSCQFALDQIRAGGSRLTCQEAAEEYADCCARSGNDGKSGPSDRTDNWSCELCAGFGDLNSVLTVEMTVHRLHRSVLLD
ncbi:unnamed protein product [Symbiodinium necroappetens]|uniref:Uncharacterized protein n=1 Tax=Symbiodinium necroappetens TaxID=1628268 RepID=A0A813C6E1_9DINO|nr:unnamed protein product [Symbiodinium necroappetens]